MTLRHIITYISLVFSILSMDLRAHNIIVVDSATHIPLPNATIYDKNGLAIGLSDNRGVILEIARRHYPITVRYLGYNDKSVLFGSNDTICLTERVAELPEVIVKSNKHLVLHVLAYVREYSTLYTYTDTIFLFREKLVDFMLPSDKKMKFKGWSSPRLLTCKSYYRFTNNNGLDSVSDACQHHFSWSDWIGMPPKISIPSRIRNHLISTDTVFGKYSPTEIWERCNDSIWVNVDVLADTLSRKWSPNIESFFRSGPEFEKFKATFCYDNITGDSISNFDLYGYSFSIESEGRGREMFRFNKINEQFFVNTNADIFILDKQYITSKSAKKWEKRDFDIAEIGIVEPMDAPPLSPSILELVRRVNLIDKDKLRLNLKPDQKLGKHHDRRQNSRIVRRALTLLKNLIGIN